MPAEKLKESLSRQSFPASSLYVIGTPIGNMADISIRSLHILELADAIACEDTRTTGSLLSAFGLKKELLSAHKHNEHEAAARIIALLKEGRRVALVSDAGTPGISDPGARIVSDVRKAGLNVIPVPGPSAVITALSAAGLDDERFLFAGFLPAKAAQRKDALTELKDLRAALVFYEAPHRLKETLDAMADVFGKDRKIVVARELTKLFEEFRFCRLADAQKILEENPDSARGEFVLIIEGAPEKTGDAAREAEILSLLLEELPVKSAVSVAEKLTGAKRKALYSMALEIKNRQEDAL